MFVYVAGHIECSAVQRGRLPTRHSATAHHLATLSAHTQALVKVITGSEADIDVLLQLMRTLDTLLPPALEAHAQCHESRCESARASTPLVESGYCFGQHWLDCVGNLARAPGA